MKNIAAIALVILYVGCTKTQIKTSLNQSQLQLTKSISNVPNNSYSGVYIDDFSNWFKTTDSIIDFVSWYKQNGLNAGSEYELQSILSKSKNYNAIATFNHILRKNGATYVTAIGGDSNDIIKYYIPFNKTQSDTTKRFNYFNLENEFWNSGNDTWAQWLANLKSLTRLGRTQSPVVKTEAYIGWPTGAAEYSGMVQYADRLLVHDYYTTPSWGYIRTRLDSLGLAAIAQKKIEPIIIIFDVDISNTYFESNNFTDAYQIIVNSYDTTNMSGKNGIQLIGYQIFASAEAMNMPQNLTNKLTSSGDTKDVADNNLK